MPNRFKQLVILTALIAIFSAALVAVKSLNIEPKLIVSGLTHTAVNIYTYLSNYEFLLSFDKLFAAALLLLLVIIRALMIKIAAS